MNALSSILAHARAGALERAWSLFVAGGHDTNDSDPAALTLKGRLLKDRAMRAARDERRLLLREAAAAYARAAALGHATYPLINAATLSLLAGDAAEAATLARQVLVRVARHPDEPETPYYRAATRAEAMLLLDCGEEAAAALAEAVAVAPQAWEDHASTLRQFAAILAAQGSDAGWLDALRPPCSLHFGGHMSFGPDCDHNRLTRRIAALLERERVGFGFGALAAGADIIIAEGLLARGAELHLLLPGGVERFAALSVDPFGSEWRARFDAALERAATVRAIDPAGAAPDLAMIDLADEVAMGAALGNARRLESGAAQLLVLAAGSDDATSRSRRIWLSGDASRRQHSLLSPREAERVSTAPAAGPHRCLAALAIRLAAPAEQLAAAKSALGRTAPVAPPCFTGSEIVVGYDTVATAAEAAIALAAALGAGASVGGHYGVGTLLDDPFSGAARMAGRLPALASAAASAALPGAICVSEDFAAALEVWNPGLARGEFIGELDAPGASAPIGLHALRRAS